MPYEINNPATIKAVKYSTILRGVLDLYAEDTDDPVQDFLWKRIRNFASQRLGYFWYEAEWPEIVQCNKRQVIFDVDYGYYIPFAEDGCDTIGDVFAVTAGSPYVKQSPRQVCYQQTDVGISIYESGEHDELWVRYKPVVPELTGDNYSATAVYAEGDQVFFGDDFFNATADLDAGSAPAADESNDDWRKVSIPAIAKQYMVNGVYYDLLRHNGDGPELLGPAKADMSNAMDFALYRLHQVQGHSNIPTVGTR